MVRKMKLITAQEAEGLFRVFFRRRRVSVLFFLITSFRSLIGDGAFTRK